MLFRGTLRCYFHHVHADTNTDTNKTCTSILPSQSLTAASFFSLSRRHWMRRKPIRVRGLTYSPLETQTIWTKVRHNDDRHCNALFLSICLNERVSCVPNLNVALCIIDSVDGTGAGERADGGSGCRQEVLWRLSTGLESFRWVMLLWTLSVVISSTAGSLDTDVSWYLCHNSAVYSKPWCVPRQKINCHEGKMLSLLTATSAE